MWLAGVVTKTNREINDKMANVETAGLGPRKSLFVLVIIVGCFAVLWPRILFPLFSVSKDQIKPNNVDKSAGCCDLVFETDVNAIKIITEVCGNILKRNGEVLDPKTEQAFLSGKLTKEIIARCRQEVNMTCGMDIASFLNQNIKLGKTYKQILDEVRSYNMSNCLKMNYGVAPWTLGVPHLVGKFWMQGLYANSVRQERPPHLKSPPLHPALRERGRAIMGSSPGTRRTPSVPIVQNGPAEGRPMPIGGMRPPMGGAGGVVPPPKSSVGFLMPLYTLCIVVFFLYTVFKMLFRKQNEGGAFEPIKSNPEFRRKVFNEPSRSDRSTPETKLVVNAISGLVAEVRQQMEETHHNSHNNVNQETPPRPYTNGSVHSQRESSPIITDSKEYTSHREKTPPSWEATTPQSREDSFLPREQTPPPKESTPPPKELTPPPKEQTPPPKETTPPPSEEIIASNENLPPSKELSPPPGKIIILPELEKEGADTEDKLDEQLEENDYEEEEIDIAEEEDEPVIEDKAIRNLRSSVEKEKATVKVLGMEMTAHREGGKPWAEAPRSHTPPAPTTPPHHHHRHPTMMEEVSSIYLEGALPHQSRLLVAESETHTEQMMDELDDKDKPIVLSGKMTLSLINDESAKTTPERDNAVIDDSLMDLEDDEFTTASAATAPKQTVEDENDEASEEEEEEVEDEEAEVEKVEVKEVNKVEVEKDKVKDEVKEIEIEEDEFEEDEVEEEVVKEVKVDELKEVEKDEEEEKEEVKIEKLKEVDLEEDEDEEVEEEEEEEEEKEEEKEVEVKEVKDEKLKEEDVEEDEEEEEVIKEVKKVKDVEVEEDEGEEDEEEEVVKEVKKVKEVEVEEDEGEEDEVEEEVEEVEIEEVEVEEVEEEVEEEEEEEEEEEKDVKKKA